MAPASGTEPHAEAFGQLIVLSGAQRGQRFVIRTDATMGRGADVTVTVEDGEVSRHHARISRPAPGAFVIEDLDSRNGTYVNERRIDRAPLNFGDRIRLAERTSFRFAAHEHRDGFSFDMQRMEALARLAEDLAHDFTNMLVVFQTSMSYLRGLHAESDRDDADAQASWADMSGAVNRTAEMASRVLSYARSADQPYQAVDLSALCDEVVEMLRRTLDSSIQVRADLQRHLRVMGNNAELHQALVNLCQNARDAMPDGGELNLRAHLVSPAGRMQDGSPPSTPEVVITVADSGVGIEEQIRERIFEPGFTTKRPGTAGIGLAIVSRVVAAHGGRVGLDTAPGVGTTVRIHLPSLATARRRPRAVATAVVFPPRALASATPVIVLADDEPAVRRSIARILRRERFEVLPVGDGLEAVRTYLEHLPRPDLVILDLSMPGVSGVEALRRLRRADPLARVLILTGYPNTAAEREALALGAVGVITKPCGADELLTDIAAALAAEPTEREVDADQDTIEPTIASGK